MGLRTKHYSFSFSIFKFNVSIVKSRCNSLDFIVCLYCALMEFLEEKKTVMVGDFHFTLLKQTVS